MVFFVVLIKLLLWYNAFHEGALCMQWFTYYFWNFVVGSFLGVVMETIWCFIRFKKIESRKGLIFGPFNALYGVGTVALSFAINMTSRETVGNYFLIGVVLGSLIEYLCSYYQEKIVGTVSWDYKDFKYNLNGRINLVYSMFWGILTIFWGTKCLPIFDAWIPQLYDKVILTVLASLLMSADCIISLAACIRRNERRNNVVPKTKFDEHLDCYYTDELLDKVYANSKFVDE